MYLAIDIGGTKTLLASFEETGEDPVRKVLFPTAPVYEDFLNDCQNGIGQLGVDHFSAVGIGSPGNSARATLETVSFGPNITWERHLLKDDFADLLHCPVYIENDAKVGALSEYNYVKHDFKHMLYVPLGTGIGVCLISDGVIDTSYGDGGGNVIFVEHEEKTPTWESIISGSAIKRRFGKRASDITDGATWEIIAHDLALGLSQLITERKPDIVVIGGGAGKPFERYGELLAQELSQMLKIPIPPILPAKHAEEAVIYGCIDLIKQNNG